MLLKKTEIFIKTLKGEKTAGDKEVEEKQRESIPATGIKQNGRKGGFVPMAQGSLGT